MALTLAIFAISLVLIMVRPKPLNEATAAGLGALLMVGTGIVPLRQVAYEIMINANILLFFLGLMVVSAVADQAGFFEWIAFRAIGLADCSAKRLFFIVFGLGIAVTAFFSNDATALILTPIVFTVTTRLKLNPMPYAFVCAFIANTASIILPMSNPVNLLPIDAFHLTLGEYLRFLFVPAILVIAINIWLFLIVFRKDISVSFHDEACTEVKVDVFFKFVCAGLAATAIGYLLASHFGKPLAWPALGGGIILLAGSLAFRRTTLGKTASKVSWPILLFIFSLALLIKGLENAGVTEALGNIVAGHAAESPLSAVIYTTFGTAIGSNLINNWSMMMVSVSSLESMAVIPHQSLIYSAILGADLGPNITILGSLSSMLWLALLRQRQLDIHPMEYLKLGLLVTPPMLLIGALAVYAAGLF